LVTLELRLPSSGLRRKAGKTSRGKQILALEALMLAEAKDRDE
jgi:hypothetical protein